MFRGYRVGRVDVSAELLRLRGSRRLEGWFRPRFGLSDGAGRCDGRVQAAWRAPRLARLLGWPPAWSAFRSAPASCRPDWSSAQLLPVYPALPHSSGASFLFLPPVPRRTLTADLMCRQERV